MTNEPELNSDELEAIARLATELPALSPSRDLWSGIENSHRAAARHGYFLREPVSLLQMLNSSQCEFRSKLNTFS